MTTILKIAAILSAIMNIKWKDLGAGTIEIGPVKRGKSKSIITTNVGVNYTFKHSSFRNRLSFQAGSINMHVVCPQSYLG